MMLVPFTEKCRISNPNARKQMKRTLISVAVIGVFALCLTLDGQDATPKQNRDPVRQRLDQILKRLTLVENRLKQLEDARSTNPDWTVDGRGIIRMPDGSPIGIWGIDGGANHELPSVPAR